ncbi:GNAT family N-acetyltransferase [Agrobacterium vitis]|uniref:GNAT family N-acetyltransferase n=1 Tax=Agrobacterium vitis TaxID=373 RepID=UPI001F159579|nr:GNAT family N-acetyltransferase [Agrobacterium vitis]
MIKFTGMSDEDYSHYLNYFIADYAAEIALNYKIAEGEAVKRAEHEIAQSLPHGPKTPDHALLNIVDKQQQTIGYLWYRFDETAKSVFILDFYIFPAHRGTGQGKQALAALETRLAEQGYREIKLRVAADNDRARHIYEYGGFRVTGVNMAKQIRAS